MKNYILPKEQRQRKPLTYALTRKYPDSACVSVSRFCLAAIRHWSRNDFKCKSTEGNSTQSMQERWNNSIFILNKWRNNHFRNPYNAGGQRKGAPERWTSYIEGCRNATSWRNLEGTFMGCCWKGTNYIHAWGFKCYVIEFQKIDIVIELMTILLLYILERTELLRAASWFFFSNFPQDATKWMEVRL